MNRSLFLAAEGGTLYGYDVHNKLVMPLFKDSKGETLMGLDKTKKHLYLAAKSRIFKFNMDEFDKPIKVFSGPRVDFHQIMIILNKLYVTCTSINEIWEMDLDLNLIKKHRIRPPLGVLVKYKINYNHINNIVYYGDRFYVCLNWLTTQQYGASGVAVLNGDFEELGRFEYGWEAHAYTVIDDQRWALCGSSGKHKKVNHKHRSGLFVDGNLIFEYNPDEWFCKDFSIDDKNIYIVGGSVKERGQRSKADGTLFIINKQSKVLEHVEVFKGYGGICGCLGNGKDLTKMN